MGAVSCLLTKLKEKDSLRSYDFPISHHYNYVGESYLYLCFCDW